MDKRDSLFDNPIINSRLQVSTIFVDDWEALIYPLSFLAPSSSLVQDVCFSGRKHGFKSGWGYQIKREWSFDHSLLIGTTFAFEAGAFRPRSLAGFRISF